MGGVSLVAGGFRRSWAVEEGSEPGFFFGVGVLVVVDAD